MKLDHLSFAQLYRLQSAKNIARFIPKGRESARALCRSMAVQRALVAAARREFPTFFNLYTAPICYAVVYEREMLGAGKLADRHMLCKADLIRQFCEFHGIEFHSLREFDAEDWTRHRVEVWVLAYPLTCRMLDYQLGVSKEFIQQRCRARLCDPGAIYLMFSWLKAGQRYNPSFGFSLTPDCQEVFERLCFYAN